MRSHDPHNLRTRRHARWRRVPYAALTVLLLACGHAPEQGKSESSTAPVLLFAVDGLDWNVLLPLVQHGDVPFIASLLRRGAFGKLRSMEPTLSPVIWTSIATGKPPSDHGILDFLYVSDGSDSPRERFYTSRDRRTKAFWNILTQEGRTVDTIGWFVTFPVEPVRGVMVSQSHSTIDFRGAAPRMWKGSLVRGMSHQVYPSGFEPRVMEILDRVEGSLDNEWTHVFGAPPNPPSALAQQFLDKSKWALRADLTYLRVAQEVMTRGRPYSLMALYVGGADVFSHLFWRYAYPNQFQYPPDPLQVKDFGGMIDDYYRFLDRRLGALYALAPPGSSVILLSDHGLQAINTDVEAHVGDPPSVTNSAHHRHAPPGVFIAAGTPFQASPAGRNLSALSADSIPEVCGVLDVLPTLLTALDLPVAEDMPGASRTRLFDPAWLAEHPVRRLKTYDDPEWRARQGSKADETPAIPPDADERLKQIQALDYVN